jgi:cytochrome b subunit of formate dehydrogenase
MKSMKIFVDVVMAILLILLIPTARGNLALHTMLGFILVFFIIIHLLLNSKWLSGAIKNQLKGKLNPKPRYTDGRDSAHEYNSSRARPKGAYMLKLVFGLMITFSICTITGIVIFLFDLRTSLPFIYRLHGISGAAGIVITIFHVIVHWNYLKSFFTQRKTK